MFTASPIDYEKIRVENDREYEICNSKKLEKQLRQVSSGDWAGCWNAIIRSVDV